MDRAGNTAGKRTDRLVILAGGVASRMRQSLARESGISAVRFSGNKGMLGVGAEGHPFLDYVLFNAHSGGIRDIVLVTGERSEEIRAHYGSRDRGNNFHGLTVTYAVQHIPDGRSKPLGSADAVLHALRARDDWQGSAFLVCNSDNLYSPAAIRALAELPDAGGWVDYDMDGLRFPPERIARFGVTVTDEEGYLRRIIEKPSPSEMEFIRTAKGRVGVTMNLWRFDFDRILPYLEHCPIDTRRDEKELPAAVGAMVADHPRSMKAVPMSEHVPDLTTAEDVEDVARFLRSEFPGGPWRASQAG